ncbi:aldehyde dehydrogenase family protein [Streptomyces sp. NPDC018587]|uniref:aldehyde dehydrogenase family protein n=1 Tax=unclassified Streptomyces TaxID=2593676 RepID=UPI00379A4411
MGAALARHPGIAAVHMTGSEATHHAVVSGTGEAATAAKAADTPKLSKSMTSELGGISPIIILPGEWSGADLRYQAEHVATMRLHNSGCNCIAGQILILSSDWPQKNAFLTALRRALATAPARRSPAARPNAPSCPAWTSPNQRVRLHHRILRPGPRRRRTARHRNTVPRRRHHRRQRTPPRNPRRQPHRPPRHLQNPRPPLSRRHSRPPLRHHRHQHLDRPPPPAFAARSRWQNLPALFASALRG